METTEENQVLETPANENNGGKENVETSSTINNDGKEKNEPFKIFKTQEEFDKHSAGILNSAKNKAEKEILAMLGLKPDEKGKLTKFKEAYDATLSESEKQAKNLEELKTENESLRKELDEKNAIVATLSKITGKDSKDVDKLVKMAKGLVDENTTIDQALEQVLSFTHVEEKKTVPNSKPINNPAPTENVKNPFKKDTENYTEQGKLINSDRELARKMYYEANGKYPSW